MLLRLMFSLTLVCLVACGPPAGMHEIPRFGRSCKPGLTLRCGGPTNLCSCELNCDHSSQCPRGTRCQLVPPPDGLSHVCVRETAARIACDPSIPNDETSLSIACNVASFSPPNDAHVALGMRALRGADPELAVCYFAAAETLLHQSSNRIEAGLEIYALLASSLVEAGRFVDAARSIRASMNLLAGNMNGGLVSQILRLDKIVEGQLADIRIGVLGPLEVLVEIDGHGLACPASGALQLDPGVHRIAIHATDFTPLVRTITLRPGEHAELRARLNEIVSPRQTPSP